MDVIVSTILR